MTVKLRQLVKLATVPRVALPSFLLVAAVALVTALPPTVRAQEVGTYGKRRPLVTVHLKKGGQFTLRDAEYLRQSKGERPPSGSAPPNTPVGPLPGNTPGVGGFGGPGDDPGPKWPRGRDPRQPTHGSSGQPRGVADYLYPGLNPKGCEQFRRVDILRVEKEITYVDVTCRNGDVQANVPMLWTAVSGWERPGQTGEFYFFEAEEILYLEFPPY